MYLLILFWALLSVFWFVLNDISDCAKALMFPFDKSAGDWFTSRILIAKYKWGVEFAALAAVPVLFSLWVASVFLGFADLWDTFFPLWVSESATSAGEWFTGYILDNVLIGSSS